MYTELISELGFPIVAAIAVAGAFWFVLRFLMNQLSRELRESRAEFQSSQTEQLSILVKLIDRIRALDDSIARTETIVRMIHGLEQNWGRVGKSQDDIDKRK